MAFSVGGLASGLDTKSIISQLMDIESRPKVKLEWRSQLEASRRSIWRDLNTRLGGLQTAANALLNPATWDQTALPSGGTGTFGATSTNSAVVSGTVTGAATAGTHAIDVLQLARGEISASSGNLGAPTAGKFMTGAWYEGAANVVEGNENITALRTSGGGAMGFNTNSTITMNYTVNGVAQSANFKVNTVALGGQGTTLTEFNAWVASTIGNGATSAWNAGRLEVTTAPGTAAELDAMSFTAKNAAGTNLAAFNGSVGSTGATSLAASDGGVGAGGDTMTITQGASSWNVALAAGDQKQDIVNKINATAGIGTVASLVGGNIRLQSTTTGAASAFGVSSSGPTAAMLGFAETQSAQDASYTVNGAAYSSTTNNNVAGAITGVSLNLASVGSSTLTIAENTGSGQSPQEDWIDATKAKIKSMVDQYNSVLDLVHQKTQGESRSINPKSLGDYLAGPMARSYEFSRYGFDMRQVLSENVSGFAVGQNSLKSIGISAAFDPKTSAQNGKLSIDDAALEAALRTDPTRVQGLLGQVGAGAGVGADDGFARRISEMVSTMDSMLDSKEQSLSSQASRLQKSIQAQETRLEMRRKQYERMYTSMETMLGKLQSQGSWLSGQLASLSQGSSQG